MTLATIPRKHYNNKPFKYNYVVNGNFDIWQRGISQTANGYGTSDCWKHEITAGAIRTTSRQSFAVGEVFPDGEPCPKYFLRSVITNAGNVVSDYVFSITPIRDVLRLATKPITIKFRAKANAAKKLCVELSQAFDAPGGGSAQVNFHSVVLNLTTQWQQFTIQATCPSVVGKIFGTDGAWTSIRFWWSAGSNWGDRTSNMGIQTGTFDLADVSLVEGHETDFRIIPRSEQEELFLCQEILEIIPFTLIRHLTNSNLGGTGQVRYPLTAKKPFIPIVESYTDGTLSTPGYLHNNSVVKDISTLAIYITTEELRIHNHTTNGLPNLYDFATGVLLISAER